MFKGSATHNTNTKSSNPSTIQKDGGTNTFIRPKLNIGKPGDKYEVEADRMADTIVTRGNEQTTSFFNPSPTIQKQPEEEVQKQENSEQEVQQKPLAESITPLIQRQPEEEQIQEKEEDNKEIQKQGEQETKKSEGEHRIQEKTESSPVTSDIQKQEEEIQEKEEEEEEAPPAVQQKSKQIQRKEEGVPTVTNTIESRIQKASGNGKPMSKKVKNSMESGFGADFSNVRIHQDQESSELNNQISAKAFTYKNNVFFGENQYQPETNEGKHLLAHELTHVVQQGQAGENKSEVTAETVQPQIQRFGISDALDFFADKAHLIPGFRMLTIILGVNPINMSSVDRNAANIMRAIVEFLPGVSLITRVLDTYNVFTDAANFMKEKLDTLGITGESIKNAVDEFLNALGWSDIFDLGGVWNRAKRIFTSPIANIINLGKSALTAIYDLVRKAILAPLASLAQGTRGYDLLKALLGKDPITGEPYPTTPENVIGGFMKLIGQEEIWENIKKGNAVTKAWQWFQGALTGLMVFVTGIPTKIVDTIKSLTWEDLIVLPKAFVKVGKFFVDIAITYVNWALGTVIDLLEILFSAVAPGVVPYIKKAKGAFSKILENPIAFVGNLIKAAKLGFQKFATNIGKHLKNSLLNWLLGSLAGAGVHIPQSLDFKEIIKFVASVLGLTWENLRLKLVKHLGEPAVKALETGFELVKLLVTEGPAAAWEKILEHLGNLKQMVLQEISQFVIVKVVQKAITKLVMMLNPAGAVIQAIIAIYDTITFLIDKIKQIAQVGAAVIDSISAIANGVITQAAAKVESTLAGMLTLAINFLAKFAGLGKISEAIIRIINKIREPIDKAMDKVVGWIVAKGKSFVQKGKAKVKGAIAAVFQWWKKKKGFKDKQGNSHKLFMKKKAGKQVLKVASKEQEVETFLENHENKEDEDYKLAINKYHTIIRYLNAFNTLDTSIESGRERIKEATNAFDDVFNSLALILGKLGFNGGSADDPESSVNFAYLKSLALKLTKGSYNRAGAHLWFRISDTQRSEDNQNFGISERLTSGETGDSTFFIPKVNSVSSKTGVSGIESDRSVTHTEGKVIGIARKIKTESEEKIKNIDIKIYTEFTPCTIAKEILNFPCRKPEDCMRKGKNYSLGHGNVSIYSDEKQDEVDKIEERLRQSGRQTTEEIIVMDNEVLEFLKEDKTPVSYSFRGGNKFSFKVIKFKKSCEVEKEEVTKTV